MIMKNSDVLDRWTILIMKSRFNDQAKQELKAYDLEVAAIIKRLEKQNQLPLLKAICELQEANSKIWVLEASIRKEFKSDPLAIQHLSMEEVGKRAVQIRDFNSLRIAAKTNIDKIFKDIIDIKVDHASA